MIVDVKLISSGENEFLFITSTSGKPFSCLIFLFYCFSKKEAMILNTLKTAPGWNRGKTGVCTLVWGKCDWEKK